MMLITISLSHSRRGTKPRRSQGAANFPQPPKTEGTAAVGCRERVGHCFQSPMLHSKYGLEILLMVSVDRSSSGFWFESEGVNSTSTLMYGQRRWANVR